MQKDTDEYGFKRIRCTALRISNDNAFRLLKAAQLVKRDWRNLLMWAGFGDSLGARKIGKEDFWKVQIITMLRKGFDP